MSISRKVRLLSLAGLVSFASFVGCGSTDNNDQGTVFTAIGYYGATGGNSSTVDTSRPIGRYPLALSEGVGIEQSEADLYTAYAWLGVSNNLSVEGSRNPYIRVTKISCRYDIPGSALSVPSEEFATGVIIEGGTSSGGSAAGGSTGGGETGGDSGGSSASLTSVGKAFGSGTGYIPFPLVSSDIYAYLNNNRSALPQLPFEMVATCNATGVTRSGETYRTNDLDITIEFVEYTEVTPAPEDEGVVTPSEEAAG